MIESALVPMAAGFDPTSTAFRTDPYPSYRWLREQAPVHRSRLGAEDAWVVSRYADVHAVLRDHARFSSAAVRGSRTIPSMISMDPPDHARLRQMVARAFTPAAIQALASQIEAVAEELVATAAAQGRVEWVDAVANPLPVTVIGHVLGVPVDRREDLRRWSDACLRVDPELRDVRDIPPAILELFQYLWDVIRAHLRERRNSIIGTLVAMLEARELDERELLFFCHLLLVAGHATTTQLIASGTHLLALRPELWARLRADPGRTAGFVEEVLRFEAPLQSRLRRTTAEVEIAGVRLPAGALVLILLGSANHDPDRFPDPDRFDPARDASGQLAFGHGIHTCLGGPLARLEGEIAFRVMARRLAGIRLDPERAPQRLSDELILAWRGFSALPVVLQPAPG